MWLLGCNSGPVVRCVILIAISLRWMVIFSCVRCVDAIERHEEITGRHIRPLNPPRQYIKTHPCERSSCYPATGNLLIGRENRLTASSTCGLNKKERFCILSHLQDKKCFLCETHDGTRHDPSLNHRIGQIIYKTMPGTDKQTWWQSENGKENVTIQLDLEAEFHFTHLIISFTTFRPAAMLIERSYDFGHTWHVYRYFAYDCKESFPGIPIVLRNITDIMCSSRYSNVEPSRGGEVIFRVLPPNINVSDPYAAHVQNMLKMTNLRINFTKLHKLGDNLLDNRVENEEKYYYGISNMVVRGSCSCYGHASQCLPLDPTYIADHNSDMVHGRCDCTHNTKGLNCESCEDFYNDLPWKPAFGKQTNACKKCECNDHAVSCHFDRAVFEDSGGISGGVCDNCVHNTEGQHCDKCMNYFYRDPNEDIRSPYVCRPCNCNSIGAIDDGICDSVYDPQHNVEAGACHCKVNVKGRRCDKCKDGYWNLTSNNSEGCERCVCNIMGTVDNSGCNMYTGECNCKKLVTGKDCNQCAPETFGLSDTPHGCTPCDCDIGGSYDNYCDVVTGQCRCRPHMAGRTCEKPKQNYFIPQLNIIHDAELSEICYSYSNNDNCSTVPYQISTDRASDFTGNGFKRVTENTELIIDVNDIPASMPYDVIVRYQTTSPGNWDNAYITLVRPDEIDLQGECAYNTDGRLYESRVLFTLPENQRQAVVLRDVCLEAGKSYKFKIHFERRRQNEDNPTATIMIDSLVIIPRLEMSSIFRGSPIATKRLNEYTNLGCNQSYDLRLRNVVSERCRQLENYASMVIYDGASMCNCNPTGSLSKECDSYGGFCNCKPSVVGRQCDQCAPGTYGFGPEGCKACDCNSIGSRDNNCDVITGQCACHPNTYGRECDQCQPGYWSFPNCQVCECNGHAQVCDPRTGECTNCGDFTTGYACDACLDGYYGDPLLGSEIGCRPCRCPDTFDSNNVHADSCSLDGHNNNMICNCKEGYDGARCEICADNYFGNADGGTCEKCECNTNVNKSDTGNCDRKNGRCLKCLHNTTGDHCDLCRDGFYGNAIEKKCVSCDCDLLGTNKIIQFCDRHNGQCPCLPNVGGLRCDECIENHWKIGSGKGCEACECDPIGSLAKQCNHFTGQCECRQGFGGRACNQCQSGYWGNPNNKCQPCNCSSYGSAETQCDRASGQCVCHEGIGGYKCDKCSRGFIGNFPHCIPCGECFVNWNFILNRLNKTTSSIIMHANEIKQIGATGAYTAEFNALDKKLQTVRNLLLNNIVGLQDIDRFNHDIDDIRQKLAASQKRLFNTETVLENNYSLLSLSSAELEKFQLQSDLVKKLAHDLKENGIQLQELNIEGALNLTRNAFERVLNLAALKDKATKYGENTEHNCKRVEILNKKLKDDSLILAANVHFIDDYRKELSQMTALISVLNNDVCDKYGDPCDNLCGGAGCGRCGGLSCERGALTRSEQGLKIAKDAQKLILYKKEEADQTLRSLFQVQVNATEAFNKVKTSYENAEIYFNHTFYKIKIGEVMIINLTDFINNNTALPTESKELGEKTLKLDLTLDPEQIKILGRMINDAVSSLQNVESIIYNTRSDLENVKGLQGKASSTKTTANNILNTATSLAKNIIDSDRSQKSARNSIQQANGNIELAIMDLDEINLETTNAQAPANITANEVDELAKKINRLQKNLLKNELDAKEIKFKANQAKADASTASLLVKNLEYDFNIANNSLNDRTTHSETVRIRAKKLLQRASKLTVDINEKLRELKQMENYYTANNNRLVNLRRDIEPLSRDMEKYLPAIQTQSGKYRQCTM